MTELGVLETDFDPIADTFGTRFAAEALEADTVVNLFGCQVVVRNEEDDRRFLPFREETVKSQEKGMSQNCYPPKAREREVTHVWETNRTSFSAHFLPRCKGLVYTLVIAETF